jgi:hypothetical protein
MTQDPIVDEIHRIREQIAEQANNDLAAICRAARERQAASGQDPVAMPPRKSDEGDSPKRAAG